MTVPDVATSSSHERAAGFRSGVAALELHERGAGTLHYARRGQPARRDARKLARGAALLAQLARYRVDAQGPRVLPARPWRARPARVRGAAAAAAARREDAATQAAAHVRDSLARAAARALPRALPGPRRANHDVASTGRLQSRGRRCVHSFGHAAPRERALPLAVRRAVVARVQSRAGRLEISARNREGSRAPRADLLAQSSA